MQADVLSSITPKALAPLAGDPAGPAAFLLIRLAFLVALVAGFPLLMGPFRQASARAGCKAAWATVLHPSRSLEVARLHVFLVQVPCKGFRGC